MSEDSMILNSISVSKEVKKKEMAYSQIFNSDISRLYSKLYRGEIVMEDFTKEINHILRKETFKSNSELMYRIMCKRYITKKMEAER